VGVGVAEPFLVGALLLDAQVKSLLYRPCRIPVVVHPVDEEEVPAAGSMLLTTSTILR
jgi:hypothetical protein